MVFNRTMDLLPLKRLLKGYPKQVFFLTYHDFKINEPLVHLDQLYQIRSLSAFEKDLDFLLSRFEPISLESIKANQLDPAKKYFHLCFDDGLKGVFEHVMPLLIQKGVDAATVFINPPFIGNKDISFRFKINILFDAIKKNHTKELKDKLTNVFGQKPLRRILGFDIKDELYINHLTNILDFSFDEFLATMPIYGSMEDLQNWESAGFTIGAHSMYHPYFHRIDQDRRQKEIAESVGFVANNFNQKLRVFSYPYNDFSLTDEEIKGFVETNALDFSFGNKGVVISDVTNHHQRIPMDKSDGLKVKQVLKKYLFQRYSQKILNL